MMRRPLRIPMIAPLALASELLVAALSLGCDDLEPPDPSYDAGYEPPIDAGPDAAPLPMGGPHVVHTYDVDGFLTRVDAVDHAAWIHVDLDTGLEVDGSDARWDLRLRRFEIELNGGISGSTGVEVALVEGATLERVTTEPTEGYVTDTSDARAFDTWYGYDEMTHILTPAARVYVVRTNGGATVPMQMVGYYNGAGTSGNPSFRWKSLP